jgi:MscS family membrane protein
MWLDSLDFAWHNTLMQAFIDLLPEWALIKWYGTALWVWIALPLLFVTAYSVTYVLGRLADAAVRLLLKRKKNAQETVLALLHPFELLAALAVFNTGKQIFPISKTMRGYTDLGALFVSTYAVAWLFFALSKVLTDRLERALKKKQKRAALAILPLLRRFLRVTILILAILFLLQNLGFNVAALLAGLGVGGIAIALASQKSMENLFGGIMLILDQPVRVGDYCKFGDNKSGTVEDVGLRSTRVRTPDNTVVSIPNSEFSQMQLENFAERKKMMFKSILALRYGTTTAQVKRISTRIVELLDATGMVGPDRHVCLINFGAYALEMEVFAYLLTSDNDKFLQMREELMLKIMDIIREEGSGFAYPSQTLYVEGDSSSLTTREDD